MSWKIYKLGQGYWTRTLSGVGGGVLAAAGAIWLMEKLSVIQSNARVYIQAVACLLVLAVLGPIIYKLVAVKPRSSDFLIATEGEMKKVNWPSRQEVKGSTFVVIWAVVLLTLLLFTSDVAFAYVFKAIGILEQ